MDKIEKQTVIGMITDVKNERGGGVAITFKRSGYDGDCNFTLEKGDTLAAFNFSALKGQTLELNLEKSAHEEYATVVSAKIADTYILKKKN